MLLLFSANVCMFQKISTVTAGVLFFHHLVLYYFLVKFPKELDVDNYQVHLPTSLTSHL